MARNQPYKETPLYVVPITLQEFIDKNFNGCYKGFKEFYGCSHKALKKWIADGAIWYMGKPYGVLKSWPEKTNNKFK